MENLYSPNCIRTFTGLYVNIFDPTPDMFCLEDIAHSLSQQCRFAGHLPEFYSVAQHSVHCSNVVEDKYKVAALLHDASEAYLLDIPRPIKSWLTNYRSIEDTLMEVIAKKFGFKYPLDEIIKTTDKLALEFEWDHLMLKKPLPHEFTCFSPKEAKKLFLKTCADLSILGD
jgi:5'-deoxynucleotidase YfbR-like HD superfamily hydrolase